MSSNESMKNKLVNSMKLTKQGTATTTTASEKKEEPKKVSAPKKSAKKEAAVAYIESSSRVWPD